MAADDSTDISKWHQTLPVSSQFLLTEPAKKVASLVTERPK
jgi:hypothetical protein